MVFSSFQFLFLYLPIFFIVYVLLPTTKLRNIWILLASLIFYAWGERQYTLVLLASIFLTWLFGILLVLKNSPHWRRTLLALGVSCNLALLVYYKYASFLIAQYLGLVQLLGLKSPLTEIDIHLPIGISFFTFQAISYLVDLFRGQVACQYNPLMLAMYKALFPQLISGPIVRYSQIQNDLYNRPLIASNFYEGAYRFSLGLIQKVLLANQVGTIADQVFSGKDIIINPGIAWLGILSYTLQIYFDFSGYSHMAIGLAKIMGFTFPENFNNPYTSVNITDFWRRWHISLSTWFRDYLYIPMGGNRCSKIRNYFNLILVFLLCGFWHGSKWSFIVWGAIHGFFLCIEKSGLLLFLNKLPVLCQRIYSFFIVMLAWVFFRAENVNDGYLYIKTMFGLKSEKILTNNYILSLYDLLNYESILFLMISVFVAFNLQSVFCKNSFDRDSKYFLISEILHTVIFCAMFILSLMYLAGGTFNPFIYFRF